MRQPPEGVTIRGATGNHADVTGHLLHVVKA